MIYKFPQCDWSWPEWKGDGCSTLFSSFLQEKMESSSWLVTMNCWVTPGIMGVVCKFTAWMQKVAHLWSGKVVKSGFDFCSHAVADVIMFPSPGGKKNSVDVAFCFISPLWHLHISVTDPYITSPNTCICFNRGYKSSYTEPWTEVLPKAVRCRFILFYSSLFLRRKSTLWSSCSLWSS